MNITPEQADRLKRDATDGPWMLDQQDPDEVPMIMSMRVENGLVTGTYIAEDVEEDGDARLIAAAPDLAQTIAGMEWQWSVEKHDGHRWSRHGGWVGPESIARLRLRKAQEDGETARLVCRLVGPVEVTE